MALIAKTSNTADRVLRRCVGPCAYPGVRNLAGDLDAFELHPIVSSLSDASDMKNTLRQIWAWITARSLPTTSPTQEERTNGAVVGHQSTHDQEHGYSADQPIDSEGQDRFCRWPFAKRIAETLALRRDPTSLVIGLYGPWGDGKTSTLRLMQKALGEHKHVVVIPFNPWHFQSQEMLITGFFSTLAEAVDRSLPSTSEKIGGYLKRYSWALSLASLPIGGAVGAAAKDLGEAISTVSLEELRKRIERILADSRKLVVVLIDDIDRLDRAETHAVLKLVKLSASFKHTSYVLAFDDEMVAAAIGEQYGQGGVVAGRSFLEKIVQVPLRLPPPDEIALRQMTFEGVDASLNHAQITLSQEQVDEFSRYFVDGIEQRLETPRHARLYVNALTFALPLLKSEVHPVDLMLIEGVRVFYPKLYTLIRDNPEDFLKAAEGNHQQVEAHRQQLTDRINSALDGSGVQHKGRVRHRLVEALFPRVGTMGYGHEWDRQWAQEQRIRSDQYFKRYFTYSVPPGDIADLEVAELLEDLCAIGAPEQDALLRAFAERTALPKLIRKLREREETVHPDVARQLARAIGRNGSLLPRERGMFLSDHTMTQASILVSQLLKRIPSGQEREALAEEIFEVAEPLPFGFECLRWVRHGDEEAEQERIVSPAAEGRMSSILAARIRTKGVETPLYVTFGRDAPRLLWLWNKDGGEPTVAVYLRDRFAAHPEEVDQLLDTYVGEAWGMESGLPHRGDFDRNSYDALRQLVDPVEVAANLRRRYGEELDNPQFHHGDDVPLARRIAHQFVYIHQAVQAEAAQATAGPQVQ